MSGSWICDWFNIFEERSIALSLIGCRDRFLLCAEMRFNLIRGQAINSHFQLAEDQADFIVYLLWCVGCSRWNKKTQQPQNLCFIPFLCSDICTLCLVRSVWFSSLLGHVACWNEGQRHFLFPPLSPFTDRKHYWISSWHGWCHTLTCLIFTQKRFASSEPFCPSLQDGSNCHLLWRGSSFRWR